MDNFDYSAIGKRIRALRKRKGYNQQELANIIGKSLRTVQKYESGEIEVSIAVVNQLRGRHRADSEPCRRDELPVPY